MSDSKKTNSPSKVPWVFKDEKKSGKREEHVRLNDMQTELGDEMATTDLPAHERTNEDNS